MAVLRDRPYGQFNFLVDLGDGEPNGPHAGFAEVGPIAAEVAVGEYRNGNSKDNGVVKITGLTRYPDVTLRRGLIGSLDLFRWLAQIRDGDPGALRDVTIELLSEDHAQVVQTWRLARARIVRHVSGPLRAGGGQVAVEEITLAHERLDLA